MRTVYYWYPGMWNFLQVPAVRAAVEPDEGYFSAWEYRNIKGPKDNLCMKTVCEQWKL